jgi:hypothetical protein
MFLRTVFRIAAPVVVFLVTLFEGAFAQTSVAHVAAGRYVILYRNGQIPANAEAMLSARGARLVSRHELMGISVAEAVTDNARAAGAGCSG